MAGKKDFFIPAVRDVSPIVFFLTFATRTSGDSRSFGIGFADAFFQIAYCQPLLNISSIGHKVNARSQKSLSAGAILKDMSA
jgi:hypothetical protein